VKRFALVAVCVMCFAAGAGVHALVAQSNKLTYNAEDIKAKTPKDAAKTLLDGAMQLAEDGSWERIAVGRAWYLGGDKAKGQTIFDLVTTGKKVKGSDWFRLARVYEEAGEWDKAKTAFDKAIALDSGDDSGMIEYGALANIHKDRAKAEELFAQAMKKNPRDIWNWANAGGSYLGVRPQ